MSMNVRTSRRTELQHGLLDAPRGVARRVTLLLAVALITLLALPAASTPQERSADDGSEADGLGRRVDSLIHRAGDGNIATLRSVLAELDGLVESSRSPDALYARAYVRYRLAGQVMEGGGEARERSAALLEAAQDDLEAVLDEVEGESETAVETMTLLAGIMGMRIGLEPGLGMSLGSRSGRLLSQASKLAPDNPRVLLQEGISKYNTPRMWGGSKKKAEGLLRDAVAIFAEQGGRQTAWPDWGYLDALAWLGRTLAAQGKVDEARAVYQQALAIEPEMGWIRYQLLPALDDGS